MTEQQQERQILDSTGRPARAAVSTACPGTLNGRPCGAGPDKRGPSCGFGTPMVICTKCGHDFQEVFRG